LSGVDIALWDLWGKMLGQPICRLIGGRFQEAVKPYVTAFYRQKNGNYPEDGIREAEQHLADGFTGLKLKVGFGTREDIEYIRAVRETFPDDITLMADANCAYAVHAAREILTEVADCGLYFFEELLAPEDIEGYRLLRSMGLTALAAGENLLGKHACARWISSGALDFFQQDICSSGGFTEVKKIAALCQSWNTPLLPHVWGSGVCLAASLQLLASLPPTPLCLNPILPMLEYDRSDHPFRVDLIFGSLEMNSDGMVPIPDAPGLGIEVNREVLNRFRVEGFKDKILI
jgi:D-galactarolactone cycloisomerase